MASNCMRYPFSGNGDQLQVIERIDYREGQVRHQFGGTVGAGLATGEMTDLCVLYGRILLLSLTPFLLQNVFQSFFVTAEKPQLGLKVTIAAGL